MTKTQSMASAVTTSTLTKALPAPWPAQLGLARLFAVCILIQCAMICCVLAMSPNFALDAGLREEPMGVFAILLHATTIESEYGTEVSDFAGDSKFRPLVERDRSWLEQSRHHQSVSAKEGVEIVVTASSRRVK